MRSLLRRILPKALRWQLHRLRGWLAALRFGFPARKLTVIGVTGTNGKSTVVSFIGQLLRATGHRVGWVSTATIAIGDIELLNATKLTTPSPMFLQRTLQQMVRAGCTHAVLEASSEGLAMGRLNGVPIHVAVFTNLTPEHLESHGSFEAYAKAKEELFAKASRTRGRTAIVANLDDQYAERYVRFRATIHIGCTLSDRLLAQHNGILRRAEHIVQTDEGVSFVVGGTTLRAPLLGRFNVMNLLEALAVCEQLDVSIPVAAQHTPHLKPVPGRMEFLHLGTPYRILVDYAPEPASMAALYGVLSGLGARRIIHVFGSAGGGRDRARRPVLGKFITERADVAIVTNEDPYDEDPQRIIRDIIEGTKNASPHKAAVEAIPDRRQAIARALSLAQAGDLVLLTGKACEQWLMGPRGTKIPWDDRRVIRELVQEGRLQLTNNKFSAASL